MTFLHALMAVLLTLAAASLSRRGLCFVAGQYHLHPEYTTIWTTSLGHDPTQYFNYETTPTVEYKNPPGFEFAPVFWGAIDMGFTETGTPFIDGIQQQINNGFIITYVDVFNQPDQSFEYGLSKFPSKSAAREWKKQMVPPKEDGLELRAPAITGIPSDVMWDQASLMCPSNSCNLDFVPVHLYGTFEAMASDIGETTLAYPKLPIWVAPWAYSYQCVYDTRHVLHDSIRMLDGLSNITRHLYFGALRFDHSDVCPNPALLMESGKLLNVELWHQGSATTNNIPLKSKTENSLLKVAFVRAVIFATVLTWNVSFVVVAFHLARHLDWVEMLFPGIVLGANVVAMAGVVGVLF